MDNWKEILIADLEKDSQVDIQTGPFGTQLKASEYVEEGIPMINVRNIGMGKIRPEKLEFISDVTARRLKRHILRKDDIVFGRKGAVERHVFIRKEQEGWMQGSDCIRMRFDSQEILPEYVSYYLCTKYHQIWINNLASSGATMSSLNQEIIGRIKFILPDLWTQIKIVSILSNYDNLIENNNRRIAILEEMAEEIFKEWFVRLRFPNWKETKMVDGIPEGWEITRVENLLLPVKRKKKISVKDYLLEGRFPIIDQGNGLIAGYTNDEDAVQNIPAPIIVFGDHTRRLKFINFPFASGADGTQLLYPKNDKLLPAFFFFAIKNIDLSNYAYARHFKFLKSKEVLIPKGKSLERFNKIVVDYLNQIDLLRSKNEILRKTRDLILPRLVNGKLSVEHLVETNESVQQ